jgi:hypothetical protein
VLVVDDLDRCTSAATTVEFKRYSAMTSPSRIRKKLEHVIPFCNTIRHKQTFLASTGGFLTCP